jgi:hypothetical protein
VSTASTANLEDRRDRPDRQRWICPDVDLRSDAVIRRGELRRKESAASVCHNEKPIEVSALGEIIYGIQRKLIEQLQRMMSQMIQPALTAAQTEPPELTPLKAMQINSSTAQLGDMRNIKTGTFWNMNPLADRTAKRSEYNAGATGQAALGGAPAALLALDKQNAADHDGQDYNSNFQDRFAGQRQRMLITPCSASVSKRTRDTWACWAR